MNQRINIFNDLGVRVDILEPDNFLKIKETLTRIGVTAKEERRLYQTCHIVYKTDFLGKYQYSLMHFKELFKWYDKPCYIIYNDIKIRNRIALLLQEWGLLKIIDKDKVKNYSSLKNLKVVAHKEKYKWKLIKKFQI